MKHPLLPLKLTDLSSKCINIFIKRIFKVEIEPVAPFLVINAPVRALKDQAGKLM